jgi:hypothetical protein
MKSNTFPAYAFFNTNTKRFSAGVLLGRKTAIQIPNKGTFTEQAIVCFMASFLTKYVLDPHYELNLKIQKRIIHALLVGIELNINNIGTKIAEIKNLPKLQLVMLELTNLLLDPIFNKSFRNEFKEFNMKLSVVNIGENSESFKKFTTSLQQHRHYIPIYMSLIDVREIFDADNFQNPTNQNLINSEQKLPAHQTFIQSFEDLSLSYMREGFPQEYYVKEQINTLANEVLNIKNHLSL